MSYDQTTPGASTVSFGTTAGTAAEGNDSRIAGAAQKSANLSDLASAATARDNLGNVIRRQTNVRQCAMLVGVSGGNFVQMGTADAGGFTGAANGIKTVNKRRWYGLKAANTANGSAVGGWAPVGSGSLYWQAHASLAWETVFAVYIPGATTLAKVRFWVGVVSSGNHANSADGNAVHLGARFDGVGGDTTWVASARSAAGVGNQTTAAVGPTVALDTGYAIRCRWSGTAYTVEVATIGADGTIGTYSAAASITDDLPTNTTALQWAIGCFQDGTPGVAQEVYVGDTDSVFVVT